jgi:flagellar basal-body rod protein FlgC
MSLFKVFEIAGSGMSAQSVRLNTTASNLANAESVGRSEADTYRARHPVFSAIMQGVHGSHDPSAVGVRVLGVVESQEPLERRYEPQHPAADEDGYVFLPNVKMVDEMTNMISASRTYQNNVEVMNTSKQLLLATLRLGQ